MPKVQRFHIEIDETETPPLRQLRTKTPPPLALCARELRGLYLLREPHVEDIVAAAANLDESQRRLALRLIEAMNDHKRSLLS
ncbi:MAG: hypothetical protein EA385_07090 [Salinarimonadaceae bacterium]|nr:MAG: hypothetical protein EA385_07090 [Salinarimonadaceae bacterium]